MSEIEPFTPAAWSVINFIEDYSMKKQRFPSVAEISKGTKLLTEKVVETLSTARVQESLEARGLSWMADLSETLSEEQIACLQLIYNFSDTRTKKAKLEALGISPTKYQGWRRSAKFSEAERQVAENMWGEAMPQIHQSVVQEALNGSINHQKLAYAIMGRWDEKKREAELNAGMLLKQVFEVIAQEVGDTVVLERIAKRFDGLISAPIQGRVLESGE